MTERGHCGKHRPSKPIRCVERECPSGNEAELRLIRSRKNLEDADGLRKASGGDEIINREIGAIDAILETYVAKREKLKSLKRDPRFKKLTPTERKAVIDTIEERLDAAEISARREMRGS